MGIDRSRRTTFEETADLYNETRPGYPEVLVEDILRLSALQADGRILEIGCGAGNATLAFAKRGYHLLGIELGKRLADYARQRCRAYPKAIIVQAEFEGYDLPSNHFDLAISADAFHWISPEVGYPKVMAALTKTGCFAFFWQITVDPHTAWSQAIDEIFRRRAPQFDRPNQPMDIEWVRDTITANFREYCGLEEVTIALYDWPETLSANRYITLLRTSSALRDMDETVRAALNRDIQIVIAGVGGNIQQPYRVALFHVRKA